MAAFDLGEGRRLTAAEVSESLDLTFSVFPDSLSRFALRLGPERFDGRRDRVLRGRIGSRRSSPARRARQALRADVEADASDSAERHSLRWFGNELEYDGDFFGDLPVGGYRSLVTAMAAGVDVRLGVAVTEVEHSDHDVVVHTSGRGPRPGRTRWSPYHWGC